MSRGCACATPPGRRSPPYRPGTAIVPKPRIITSRLRENVTPHRPVEAKSIAVAGETQGTRCRPFLRVEKDDTLFAACNALADKLGPLNDPKKTFKLLKEAIGSEVNEVFGVITLDLHLRFKGMAETGRGEPTSVMAPLKPTLQTALIDGAHAVIIFHVHPSGVEAEPSDADRETTDAFVEAFEAVDIPVLDHIIVGGDAKRRSYYSFAEAGDI